MVDQVVGMPEDHWEQEDGSFVFVGIVNYERITVIRGRDGKIITAFRGHKRRR